MDGVGIQQTTVQQQRVASLHTGLVTTAQLPQILALEEPARTGNVDRALEHVLQMSVAHWPDIVGPQKV